MNWQKVELSGGLWLVSTPIGNARDITLRALDVLASADVLACEDTRTLRRLLDLHGVPVAGRRMIAYHDHNGARARPKLLEAMAGGASVAYASDAGTPLISDPGFGLLRAAAEAGVAVTAAPGASAAITALTLSRLPSDRFAFLGFLPSKPAARRTALAEVKAFPGTLIAYENPGRVKDLLSDVCEELGDRTVSVARELTKKFEDVMHGACSVVLRSVDDTPPRGECVVMISAGEGEAEDAGDIESALRAALGQHRLKDAVDLVAGATGTSRRDVYQRALALKDEANE
ncbi:MAG: 16S rRNA (cytidine(1402)-2'-O)-methyltransferase [Shimia sp.]